MGNPVTDTATREKETEVDTPRPPSLILSVWHQLARFGEVCRTFAVLQMAILRFTAAR